MSGSAGLSPSRNRKPEGSTSSEYARNSKRECAGLVAGPAVLTAEIKLSQSWTIRNVGSVQGGFRKGGCSRQLQVEPLYENKTSRDLALSHSFGRCSCNKIAECLVPLVRRVLSENGLRLCRAN
jgi:hypothetical protein